MRDTKKDIILVGPAGTGKTKLLERFINNLYVDETYTATLGLDMRRQSITTNGETIESIIWDTGGQERYISSLRPTIKNAAVVIVIVDLSNLKNGFEYFTNNIRESISPNTPLILVGTKADIPKHLVGSETGQRTAEQIGTKTYFECSAKTGEGVNEIFQKAAELIIQAAKKPTKFVVDTFKRKNANPANQINIPLGSDEPETNSCNCFSIFSPSPQPKYQPMQANIRYSPNSSDDEYDLNKVSLNPHANESDSDSDSNDGCTIS